MSHVRKLRTPTRLCPRTQRSVDNAPTNLCHGDKPALRSSPQEGCERRESRAVARSRRERRPCFLRERRRRRRTLDVRAADQQEEMAEQRFFRSGSSDEDGGNLGANIAASGASNQTERDARAAPKGPAQTRGDTTIPTVPGPTCTPSTALTSEITTLPVSTRSWSRSTSRRAPSGLSR